MKPEAMDNFFPKNMILKPIICTLLLILFSLVTPALSADRSVIAPLATRSLLLDLEQVDNALIAVGERGHLLISEDNGNNWSQVQVPTRSTLTGVFFLDRQQGWVVGHDQVILRTQDGGKTWALVYENIEAESPLFDIYFLDAQHGYAIGAYGQFLESFDGGENWEGRWISEDDFHLNQIVPAGEQLFIAAEAGTVYRSDDQGENWITLAPDYEGSFFGILPLGNNSLLLFGLRGHLFRSDDGGETWSQIETATEASLTNGLLLNDGTLIVTGLAGAILISQDHGNSFSLTQEPKRKGFSRLQQTTAGDIFAVGDFGVTLLSLSSIGIKE
ncbi:MAG: YCF48-related protein [Deltaproteobacteria bacterium]|jgi:photosystem II stability/assembly factor-like uncharacterized protein|nr:YCF48-related protein [Deltaproteobacteria bacterium]MCW9049284.1 YCF48-related protein [Deltaproteobacteria bacterium]